jgi:hypothetical protein
MGTASAALSNEVFGLFELDDDGNVRYSRSHAGGDHVSMIGQNFFELFDAESGHDLRRHFKRFIDSREAANSFTFDCPYNEAIVKAKVVMTRAFQTEDFPPESIVMLDIRQSSY